jgi:hypothetical protein
MTHIENLVILSWLGIPKQADEITIFLTESHPHLKRFLSQWAHSSSLARRHTSCPFTCLTNHQESPGHLRSALPPSSQGKMLGQIFDKKEPYFSCVSLIDRSRRRFFEQMLGFSEGFFSCGWSPRL